MARKIYDSTVVIPLLKPIKYEDKTYTEVRLDFSKATADMLISSEGNTIKTGNVSTAMGNLSREYCARIAARLSGVRFDAMKKFHPVDFEAIWQTAAAFLNNRDPAAFYKQYMDFDEDEFDEEESVDKLEEECDNESTEADFTNPEGTPE